MLGRMFNQHSLVHTFGELHYFEGLIDPNVALLRKNLDYAEQVSLVERLLTTSRKGLFNKVLPREYTEDAERIVQSASKKDAISLYAAFLDEETRLNDKVIPCEQTPRYLFALEEIFKAFPLCFVINIIRDPRDVLLSQKNKWRRRFLGAKNIPLFEAVRSWSNYHPYTISRLWVSAVRAANSNNNIPGFISIKYEDLLSDPQKVLEEICQRAGLVFEPGMLQVPQVGSSTGVDHPERMGLNADRIGAWRKGGLSNSELAICQYVARDEMIKLDYTMAKANVSIFFYIFSLLTLLFKGSMALLLNVHRTRNIKQTLIRRFGTRKV